LHGPGVAWRVPPLRGGVPRFGIQRGYLLAFGEGCLRGRSLFVAQEGRAEVSAVENQRWSHQP
jgi:hypothetical protein